jgi:hypothetical protein
VGLKEKKKKKVLSEFESLVGWLTVPKCVSCGRENFFLPSCSRGKVDSFWQLIAVTYN